MKYILADLFEKPISGEWGNDVEEGNLGVKVIRTTNFTNLGRLNLSKIVYRDIDSEKYLNKQLKFGDIIIEKSGGSPTQPVGRPVVFEEVDNEIYFCNNFTSVLRPKDIVNYKYSLYLLKDLYNKGRVLKYQNKTTGIINIKLNDYIKNTEVEIPPIEEQIKVAKILDKARNLIDKRKEQIEYLDELVKSQFIELFGDLVINAKGWKEEKIQDVCLDIVDCVNRTAPIVDYETEYKMIRTSNIKKGNINTFGCNSVDEETYNKWTRRLKPEKGDVLFTREAPTGEVGLIKSDEKIFLGQRIMHYRADCSKIAPIFLLHHLLDSSIKLQVNKLATGSTVKHLSVNDCKEFVVKIPPIELQREFSQFINQVDKLKFEMVKILKELFNK